MKRSITIALLLYSLFLLLNSGVLAVNMDSARFHIQFGTTDIGAAPKDTHSNNYKLTSSLGQTAAQSFTRNGYWIRAGFEYIHSIIPFNFSVSKTNIDLGSFVGASTNTDSTNLLVRFGAAGQYQVTAIEETALKTLNGANTIPDTNCDTSCSVNNANTWTLSNKYGFGYNMSCSGITAGVPCNVDIPSDFINSTYFRPFANRSSSGQPQIVMSNTDVTSYSNSNANLRNTHQTTMTFKATVSGAQPAGTYETIINFVATPSY